MGGIFPSGGSTINDVRLSISLTAPTPLPVEFRFLYTSGFASAARKKLSPPAASLSTSPPKSRTAFFLSAATSSSVRNRFPWSAFGRSSGVASLFIQMP